MRQIDNMTPQEIETLALKGMTAPRTTSERSAPDKAQPQHSRYSGDLCAKYDNMQTHADKLAEELRQVLKHGSAGNENLIRATLAAYEAAQ